MRLGLRVGGKGFSGYLVMAGRGASEMCRIIGFAEPNILTKLRFSSTDCNLENRIEFSSRLILMERIVMSIVGELSPERVISFKEIR